MGEQAKSDLCEKLASPAGASPARTLADANKSARIFRAVITHGVQMSSTSYIPAGILPFQAWVIVFSEWATANPDTYGFDDTQTGILEGKVETLNTRIAISTDAATRTPVTVANTQAAMVDARDYARTLVNLAQASGALTEPVALAAGITWRKTTKTPITAPTETPSLDVESITPLAVTLRVRVLGAELSALPVNVVGYQVRCEIDPPTPPISPDSLHLVAVGTRRFWTTTFEAGDVGKQVFFSVRYVTAKQLYGPWSNIVATTVVSG
jgi:hypothetical protein